MAEMYICDHAKHKHCPGEDWCFKASPHRCSEFTCEEGQCDPVCPCCGTASASVYSDSRCIPVSPRLETMHECEVCGKPTGARCPCGCD